MTTLTELMIVVGVDNHPHMLDKPMYDSWQSQMVFYIQAKENGRMILESVQNGPLIWPTVEENGKTQTKTYNELFDTEKLQADYDVKSTNIVPQGLPLYVYSLVNHHTDAKEIWDRVKLFMQGMKL
uniref:Integrase, catalytic region, zinc finger, CCHC-type, peptidase aspartic, catalytic n=1 Tax=Tanacetum cinerariifolium TaxID=118510 RepID=A0A699IW76_TANCI|nr:hypothetical protein [Tanacetum cinerariifolium]